MKETTETSSQSPEQIFNELRALVMEAEEILGREPACSCAGSFAELRDRIEAAQERVTNVYRDVREKAAEGAKRADEYVRANPYQSIAVALGIGLLAGVLLGRSSR